MFETIKEEKNTTAELRPAIERERGSSMARRGGQAREWRVLGGVQNSFPLCLPHTLHLQKGGHGWETLALSRGITCLACAGGGRGRGLGFGVKGMTLPAKSAIYLWHEHDDEDWACPASCAHANA
ncbi:hypothetical protein QQP08_010911 [Theobroma cacao]|nr:hypothetical protein QQP08_010911 [Theobroma cacao]